METYWFLRLWFRRAYNSAFFWGSRLPQGRKALFDSIWNSDHDYGSFYDLTSSTIPITTQIITTTTTPTPITTSATSSTSTLSHDFPLWLRFRQLWLRLSHTIMTPTATRTPIATSVSSVASSTTTPITTSTPITNMTLTMTYPSTPITTSILTSATSSTTTPITTSTPTDYDSVTSKNQLLRPNITAPMDDWLETSAYSVYISTSVWISTTNICYLHLDLCQ